MTIGYSGTPLPKKLGITASMQVTLIGVTPPAYEALLGSVPVGVELNSSISRQTDLLHLFVKQREELATYLVQARQELHDDAIVWVSWYKKAAKMPTNITEDVIRELALPLGFVDIKVCAVSDVWSGLKLVVRKELRGKNPA